MTIQSVPLFRAQLIMGVLGFAALSLVASGCSSTAKIAQSAKGNVYLEEVADWSFEASHPAVIDQATMMKIVKGLYNDESQNGTSRMSAGGSKPMRIFSDEDAEFLAPLLAQGLSKAKPEQLVGFRVSSPAGSGSEPTTGSIYVQRESIYITIARGGKITGFSPESVAHVESAPSYAAGGNAGSIAAVIDYHSLAKTSQTALPMAKASIKTPSTPAAIPAGASVTTSGASVSSKMESSAASTNVAAVEYQTPEINEIEKVKDTIAKKDTEISMLRKEAAWMKRQLRDRDEEIKALKATKVKAKPAPKKKQAQLVPTPKSPSSVSSDIDDFRLK